MDLQDGFGKQGIGVELANSRQRKASRFPIEVVGGCNPLAFFDKLIPQAWIGFRQCSNGLFARIARQFCDVLCSRGEEFLLAHLRHLPRRIAQHTVEAALRKHLRKGQRPVEHAGLFAGRACGGDGRGVLGLGALRVGQQRMQGDAGGHSFCRALRLGQQVGAHQRIGGVGQRAVGGVFQKAAPGLFLGGHLLGGVSGQGFDGAQGIEAAAVVHAQQHLLSVQILVDLLETGGVGLGQLLADVLVVAAQGLEGILGDALFEHVQVGQAQ